MLIQEYSVMWCVLKYGIESFFHTRFQIVVILIETLFLFLSFLLVLPLLLLLRIAAHFFLNKKKNVKNARSEHSILVLILRATCEFLFHMLLWLQVDHHS